MTNEGDPKLKSILNIDDSRLATAPVIETLLSPQIEVKIPSLAVAGVPEPGPTLRRGNRTWLILMALTEEDPEDPDNPSAFRYTSLWKDDGYLREAYPDTIDLPGFDATKAKSASYASLKAFLEIIENPYQRSPAAIEKAQALIKDMIKNRPRFSEMSQNEVIQELKDLLTGKKRLPKPVAARSRVNEKPKNLQQTPPVERKPKLNLTRKGKEPRPRGHAINQTEKKSDPGTEKQRRNRGYSQRRRASELVQTTTFTRNPLHPIQPEPLTTLSASQLIKIQKPDSETPLLDHITRPGQWTDLPFEIQKGWKAIQPHQEQELSED